MISVSVQSVKDNIHYILESFGDWQVVQKEKGKHEKARGKYEMYNLILSVFEEDTKH